MVDGTWVAPIGIPPPDFGLEETYYMYKLGPGEDCTTHPGKCYDFGSGLEPYKDAGNGPYTHYVDNRAGNCILNWKAPDGTSASFGTPEKPLCRIPVGSDGLMPIAPGSVIELASCGGSHQSPNQIVISATEDKPVFIRGVFDAEGNMGRMGRTVEVANSSYVIFENISIYRLVISSSNHLVLRHSEIQGDALWGGTGLAADDSLFWDNRIYDGERWWDLEGDHDTHGITPNGHNLWIVDNEIFHNSGDGIQVHGGSHIYIGRNLIWGNKQTGAWAKAASDIIVSENIIHSHIPSGSSGGEGIGGQYAPIRMWALFNEIYDNTRGIRFSGGSGAEDTYIIGNVISNTNTGNEYWITKGEGVMSWDWGTGLTIIGNTMYDVITGIATKQDTINAYNNIIATTSDGDHVEFWLGGQDRANFNNNLFFKEGGTASFDLQGTIYDLSQFQSITEDGKCQSCIEEDPLFVDAVNGDFALASSDSPAVDAGVLSDVYAEFENLYGLDIAKDIDGRTRPFGNGWDIGAFEFQGSACVDMEALLNYISQWRQGSISMPSIISRLASWKSGEGC